MIQVQEANNSLEEELALLTDSRFFQVAEHLHWSALCKICNELVDD